MCKNTTTAIIDHESGTSGTGLPSSANHFQGPNTTTQLFTYNIRGR